MVCLESDKMEEEDHSLVLETVMMGDHSLASLEIHCLI